jgi:hypothetical protein
MFLGTFGGTAEHRAQYGRAYREAWTQTGHPAEAADIAVVVHGFVADGNGQAKATYLDHELRTFTTGAPEIGRGAIGVRYPGDGLRCPSWLRLVRAHTVLWWSSRCQPWSSVRSAIRWSP